MSKIIPNSGVKYPEQAYALKEIRKAKGWTQQQVADKLSSSEESNKLRTYQKWERGEERINTYALVALSDLYGVSCDHLLGRIKETTHDLKFICEETGLSESAVKILIKHKNHYMLHNDNDSVETFPAAISSIIEHDRFPQFVFRLMQSKSLKSTITKLHRRSKEKIQAAHLYLSQMGYTILAPGQSSAISVYDAKQEISRIVDDLFSNNEPGFVELRR